MSNPNEIFKKNLEDYFGINHVTQPPFYSLDRLSMYVGYVIPQIDASTDILLAGNNSSEFNKFLTNPYSINFVKIFNTLVNNFVGNFSIKTFGMLKSYEKPVFEAFLFHKLTLLYPLTKLMLEDNFGNNVLGYYGIDSNVDVLKHFYDKINNKNMLESMPEIKKAIAFCEEVEKYNRERKPSNCIIS